MRAILTILAAGLLAAGCDSGGLGGFGRSILSGPPTPVAAARAAPDRPLAEQVIDLRADPAPGGIIVTAVALPPTQGFWDPRLVRVPTGDPSVYLMEFRLLPPLAPAEAGTSFSREVVAGALLTSGDLAGIRTVAVRGARNERTLRR